MPYVGIISFSASIPDPIKAPWWGWLVSIQHSPLGMLHLRTAHQHPILPSSIETLKLGGLPTEQMYISQAVAFKNYKQGFYIKQNGLRIHQGTLLRAVYLHGKQCLFCLVHSELQKPAFLVASSDSSKIVLSGRGGLLSPIALCSSHFFFSLKPATVLSQLNHCKSYSKFFAVTKEEWHNTQKPGNSKHFRYLFLQETCSISSHCSTELASFSFYPNPLPLWLHYWKSKHINFWLCLLFQTSLRIQHHTWMQHYPLNASQGIKTNDFFRMFCASTTTWIGRKVCMTYF